ncbi:patatin-like phospholipase family protein [Kordiimonas sp.]|uniref:patatin-like phospholipase family protein n=1 Tax=Kordiimonas sp. TaxID=1970157 RepID=UPI003A950D16
MKALRLVAGKTARKRIEANGLTPEMVRMVVGASGGPKWLVLRGLDQFVFGNWLVQSNNHIDMVGSSIGAWRMTIASHPEPGLMFKCFEDAYFGYRKEDGASPEAVTRASYKILSEVMGPKVCEQIVSNPKRNLNIVAVRCVGPTASSSRMVEGAGLLAAASLNAISRSTLKTFFKRAVFYSGDDVACSALWRDFDRIDAKLSPNSLHDALMASGSIPFVVDPVIDIEGAPKGVYRDGGVIDYHFDVPWSYDEGIVLYPHFYGHLVPGWFDKMRKNRKAGAQALDQQLVLAPSDEFVASLPYGRIPDRKNFSDMEDTERKPYWRKVVDESYRLADELSMLLEKPDLLLERLEAAPE